MASQLILVSTEDAVLGKKIRFLLARDECDVEIVPADKLGERLKKGGASLLIASHQLQGRRTVDMLKKLRASQAMPRALLLGGPQIDGLDFVRVISEPGDTQAIYRQASEALAAPPLSALPGSEMSDDTAAEKTIAHQPAPFEEERVASNRPRAAVSHDDTIDSISRSDLVMSETDQTMFDVVRPTEGDEREEMPAKQETTGPKGQLEPGTLAKALFQCWTMEARGALVLTKPDETLTIFFEEGFPVHVTSSIPGDQLGRTLVSKGSLSDGQYGQAAKRAIERGCALGTALVELGLLTKEALGHEQGEDAHERVIQCFGAKGGSFDFVSDKSPPGTDRPYRIPVGRILVDGLRDYTSNEALAKVVGPIDGRYFKLRASIDALKKRFPLDANEKEFLGYSGRAYNVMDAAEASNVDGRGARVLMALLMTCEEVDDFTPGIAEFEARIKEERVRVSGRPSVVPAPAPAAPPPPVAPPIAAPPIAPAPPPVRTARPIAPVEIEPDRIQHAPFNAREGSISPALSETTSVSKPPIHVEEERAPEPPPPAPPPPMVPPTPPSTPVRAHPSIPPMPANGGGRGPRVVAFAQPLPRTPDGHPQETTERQKSREHFQRGVTLLGQGNFDDAEEAFREAIALCSEEHVYLIGLARAIYYNPSYSGPGKLPVLRTIVDRATQLAPDDGRVTTLHEWVRHAETQR
ncbi:MAG: tetratricopeptide repeat protein [Deltaproteobacteria bacterium]|nr:tetratricopeptide repeat protein [Deltaproteobacteria bacterium]